MPHPRGGVPRPRHRSVRPRRVPRPPPQAARLPRSHSAPSVIPLANPRRYHPST